MPHQYKLAQLPTTQENVVVDVMLSYMKGQGVQVAAYITKFDNGFAYRAYSIGGLKSWHFVKICGRQPSPKGFREAFDSIRDQWGEVARAIANACTNGKVTLLNGLAFEQLVFPE